MDLVSNPLFTRTVITKHIHIFVANFEIVVFLKFYFDILKSFIMIPTYRRSAAHIRIWSLKSLHPQGFG